jgi:nucleotide-binding universal stress UspA family protein
MARLLADTKKRVEKGLESDYDLNQRTEAEILPKLAEERGAASLVEKARRLRKESKEAEAALGKLGFACDEYSDDLSLADDAPKDLRRALEEAQRSGRKEREVELLKYDKAILKVWAAQDAEEAKGIVEELL